MKFIVAVDMEGIALGYAMHGSTIEETPNAEWVKKQGTREANAAVKALFDNGATEVLVWDAHAYGCNLEFDELDERVKIAIGGSVNMRYPELDESYSGVVFIGYHAMASHPNAVAAHTYMSSNYQSVKLNGVEEYVKYDYVEIQDSYGSVVKETVTATYKYGDITQDEFETEKDGKGNVLKVTANSTMLFMAIFF